MSLGGVALLKRDVLLDSDARSELELYSLESMSICSRSEPSYYNAA